LNRKINDRNALPKEEMRYEEFSHSTKKKSHGNASPQGRNEV
jgi:hypothetical protein